MSNPIETLSMIGVAIVGIGGFVAVSMILASNNPTDAMNGAMKMFLPVMMIGLIIVAGAQAISGK